MFWKFGFKKSQDLSLQLMQSEEVNTWSKVDFLILPLWYFMFDSMEAKVVCKFNAMSFSAADAFR